MKLFFKKLRKHIILTIIFLVFYFVPFWAICLTDQANIIDQADKLPNSEAVLIFGTVVRNGQISPLLKERLEAGKKIMEVGKTEKLVVSNMENATNIMANYLYETGIPKNKIELDPQAEQTPDTCKYEKQQHPEGRKVIFVSQRFHLPRLMFQCKKAGVEGVGFPAESINIIDSSQYSLFTKFSVRSKRYFREAGLTWLALLNIYK